MEIVRYRGNGHIDYGILEDDGTLRNPVVAEE